MKNLTLSNALALCLTVCAGASIAQTTTTEPTPATRTSPVAPDNTKMNKPITANNTPTADAQSNSATDMALTQRIRKSVMADSTLSTYAHNVKIVAVNGKVTLNGVVRTAQEKDVVYQKAEALAGRGTVSNELTVAPSTERADQKSTK